MSVRFVLNPEFIAEFHLDLGKARFFINAALLSPAHVLLRKLKRF